MTRAPLLNLGNASFAFGRSKVFSNLNLSIGAGSFTLLLGANGVGKSTFLKVIAGLYPLHSGLIEYGEVKVSYAGHAPQMYGDLTVRQNLEFFLAVSGHSENGISSLLAEWGLSESEDHLLRQLSEGQRKKLSLALAFAVDADLILLDEPTSNLDPRSREIFSSKIEGLLKAQKTILLVTHEPTDFFALTDRVLFMSKDAIQEIGSGQDCTSEEFKIKFFEMLK